jgi:Asp/Glu/hydantoin racemase
MQRRFTEDVVWAEEAGADAVLVTCSTVSPCVDEAQDRVAIPVVKIDQAMIDKAIHIGTSIGVVATAATTLEPSCELVKSRSRAAGKDTVIHSVLCEGALEAMLMGEDERHDAIVLPYLYDVMEKSEVVILAQASMARILDRIPEDERQVPVLSSPRLAVEHVCGLLEQP